MAIKQIVTRNTGVTLDLSNIPNNGDRYFWKDSIGKEVKFNYTIYNGKIIIEDYNKNYLLCHNLLNDRRIWFSVASFYTGQILRLVTEDGKHQKKNKQKYQIG